MSIISIIVMVLKFLKLHTLSVCNILYINYSSVNLGKKNDVQEAGIDLLMIIDAGRNDEDQSQRVDVRNEENRWMWAVLLR